MTSIPISFHDVESNMTMTHHDNIMDNMVMDSTHSNNKIIIKTTTNSVLPSSSLQQTQQRTLSQQDQQHEIPTMNKKTTVASNNNNNNSNNNNNKFQSEDPPPQQQQKMMKLPVNHKIPKRLDFTAAMARGIRRQEMDTLLDYATCTTTDNNNNNNIPPPAIWIEAEAGVGKSTLLQQFRAELDKPATDDSDAKKCKKEAPSAICISGKFEQRAAASEPFAALREAVAELVNYIMDMDAPTVQQWSQELQNTLESDTQLLCRILPALRRLFSHTKPSNNLQLNDSEEKECHDEEEDAFGDFNSKEYRFERFRLAFRSLIRYTCAKLASAAAANDNHNGNATITTTPCCLVMILDDFHWVDPDSLQIVKTLMDDQRKPHNFLLVCATRPIDGYVHLQKLYQTIMTRSNNSSTTNILRSSSRSFTLDSVCSRKLRIMGLPRLSVSEIQDILQALLLGTEDDDNETHTTSNKKDDSNLLQFAEIVKAKTQGNSFVVMQFLRLLERSGHLRFDCAQQQWHYDLMQIAQVDKISDNVSKVVAHSLQTGLDRRRKSALMVAASFGVSQFDVSTIVHAVTVLEQQQQEQEQQHEVNDSTTSLTQASSTTISCCWDEPAEEYEDPYVVRRRVSDMSTQLSEAALDGLVEETSPGHFRFSHDRIRESAYSLLPEGNSRKAVHLKVGRQLRSWMDTQSELGLFQSGFSKESLLLHATKQLNAGADLIDDDWELLDLADLNYQAAELAARKTAFFSSMEYLQIGLSHMGGDDAWERNYDRVLRFGTALTRMQYSCGLLDECWETAKHVIANSKTFADKARIYHTMILCLVQKELMDEAFTLNLEVLDLMEQPMPRRFVMLRVFREFMKARKFLNATSDEEFLDLPPVHDEYIENLLDFLQSLAENGFLTGKFEYVFFVSFRYLTLVAERGNYPRSFFATMLYACFFKTNMGDFAGAMRYATLANKLSERQKANIPGFVARSDEMYYAYVNHWQAPIRDSLNANIDAFKRLWAGGLVETALMDASTLLQHMYAAGEPLDRIVRECAKYSEASEDYQHMVHWYVNASQHQAMLNLQGHSNDPAKLTGDIMEADSCLETWKKTPNPPALYNFQFWSMVLGFHCGDLQNAKRNIKAMRGDLFEDGSCAIVPLRPFYTGLVYNALFRTTKKGKYRRRAKAAQKQLNVWVSKGAVNCVYMSQLLEAEDRAYWQRSTVEATMAVFDQAIESASSLGVIHHTAVGNLLAAEYLDKQNLRGRGILYLEKAIDLYQNWGALGIVNDLKRLLAQRQRIGPED